jgi:SAM-dependent methyltransferase
VPWLSWLILVFIPSSWLMGVTAYLTTDLASIPLMWIIPLALYLVSFILAFDARGAKIVRAAARSLPYLIAPLALVMIAGFVHLLWVPLHLITFFAGCLACHGALAGMRPPPLQLASFYLSIALGGLVGGTWSAIVAPLIFDRVVEYPLALVLAALVIPGARARELTRHWHELSRDLVFAAIVFSLTALLATNSSGLGDSALGVLGVTIASGMGILSCVRVERRPLRFALVIAAILTAGALAPGVNGRLLHIERNFFGVLRVTHDSGQNVNRLFHGSTLHGQQSLGPLLRREPSTYFTRSGPIGQVFRAVQERLSVPHARVAIVGLGAGTLASYAQPGQRWSFYELDPAVERIARDPRFFTYLRDCQARSVDVILGDARRRLRDAADRAYLLIVLDAFSSDALPVHLLSREAIRLYRSKLAPGGLLLFNLSNRYLDLDPVIGRQAVDAGLVCRVCYDVRVSDDEKRAGKQPSIWALLAADETDLGTLSADPRWQPPALRPGSAVWTDDYSDLASYLLLTPGARRGHDRPATVSPGRE